jgi:hypothetical protein
VDGGVDNGSARLGAHIGVVMVMVLILVCTILSFYYDHGISVIDGGRPKIHHINMPLRPKRGHGKNPFTNGLWRL